MTELMFNRRNFHLRTAIEREKHLIEKKNKGPKFELGAKDLEEHRFGALSNAGSSP